MSQQNEWAMLALMIGVPLGVFVNRWHFKKGWRVGLATVTIATGVLALQWLVKPRRYDWETDTLSRRGIVKRAYLAEDSLSAEQRVLLQAVAIGKRGREGPGSN